MHLNTKLWLFIFQTVGIVLFSKTNYSPEMYLSVTWRKGVDAKMYINRCMTFLSLPEESNTVFVGKLHLLSQTK